MILVRSARSELAKQLTTSMWWILALVLLVYVGSTAAGLALVFSAGATGAFGGADAPPVNPDSLPALLYSLASSVGYVFPLLIGTLIVTGEFRHKTLTPTFLAIPRRGIVLSGKIVAGIILGVIFAAVALVASLAPSAGILAGFGLETGLSSADTWALVGRVALALVLWVLVGIGVGSLVRNQVAAIVLVLAFTQFIEPIARVAASLLEQLGEVTKYLPGAASDALVGSSFLTLGMAPAEGALEWWVGGLVLLGYAVVLLFLGYLVSWRRDVT